MTLITCPNGHTWDYRGRSAPGQYICCPKCSTRFRRPFPEKIEILNEYVCIAPCQFCGREGPLSVVMAEGEVQLLCGHCISTSQMYQTYQSF